MVHFGIITTRSLKCQFERISDITSLHSATELPANHITAVIIENGRQIIPDPIYYLKIGKVRLPVILSIYRIRSAKKHTYIQAYFNQRHQLLKQ